MGGLLRPSRRWVCACYVTSRAWRCLQRRLPGNRARLVEAAAGSGLPLWRRRLRPPRPGLGQGRRAEVRSPRPREGTAGSGAVRRPG